MESDQNASRGDVVKWADEAMFVAEQMPEEALAKPQVHLLWMTPDPLGAMAAMNNMYEGTVSRSLADVTREEREQVLSDMQKTALKAPAEAVKFHFLIEGVTRGFTHQLVRQRTAVYAQESTRFATFGQEGQPVPVGLPPSLHGTETVYDDKGLPENRTREEDARLAWDSAMDHRYAYRKMVDLGMPAEDARGLLPTNLLTRIHYVTDLRNLHAHAGLRLSTQAQFEWRTVWAGIIQAIRNYDPLRSVKKEVLRFADSRGGQTGETRRMLDQLYWISDSERWQYDAISELFRPICYYTGKCEFMGTADRYCSIRERVQLNHEVGRPPSEWHEPTTLGMPGSYQRSATRPELSRIPAIHPAEWLSDAAAARRAKS
jgi:flavin-dependent thymidylate synthase